MPAQSRVSILIIEPNKKLIRPYSHLSNSFLVNRVPTIELALQKLSRHSPDIVFLSASFSASKSIKLLEALKNISRFGLIPLVIVIDFSHRLNFVPGTSWGDKIAVLDSFVSKKELLSTLNRLLKS